MLSERSARRLIVGSWIVLVAALLGVRELHPPDEPRFTHQAQEMRDRGDWIVPRIGGVPVPDKPPMLFWGVNLFSLPLDRNAALTARIPSALAALAVLLLTFRLGRRLWGSAAVGAGAALVLLTGIEFFQKAQWVSTDMLLTAWVYVALTCWREVAFEAAGGRGKALAGWLAVAGGALTKGPLALLWPWLFLLAEAWSRRNFRALGRVLRPEGPAALLAVVGAWLIAVGQAAGAGFVINAVFVQSVDRYAAAPNSIQPWYFYLGQFPADLLPWSLLLPGVIALGVAAFRGARDVPGAAAVRALSIYVGLGLLFFSGSSGKRGVYLLPAFPAFALLASATLLAAGRDTWRAIARWGIAALGALAVAVAVWAPSRFDVRPIEAAGLALGGAFMAVGGVVAARAVRRPERSLLALATGVGVFLVLGCVAGGPAWNRFQGAEAYGARVASLVPPSSRIAIERSKFELIVFYSERQGTEFETDAALGEELAGGRCDHAILKRTTWERLRGDPRIDALAVLDESRVGGKEFVLLGPNR